MRKLIFTGAIIGGYVGYKIYSDVKQINDYQEFYQKIENKK